MHKPAGKVRLAPHSARRRLHFAIPIALALVVTLAMAWQIHRLDVRSLGQVKGTVQEQQLANVRNCQLAMGGLLKDCIARAQRLAEAAGAGGSDVQEWAQNLVDSEDHVFAAIMCWDRRGQPLWATQPDLPCKPPDGWDQVEEAVRQDSFYSCRLESPAVAQDESLPPERVLVVAAAPDAQGQMATYVGAVIDMEQVMARTVHPIPSSSYVRMQYWVLDGAGRVLLHLAPPATVIPGTVYPRVVRLSAQQRQLARQIGQIGWSKPVYEGVAEIEDLGELLAFRSLYLGTEHYLLAVTSPSRAVAQIFRSHRLTTTSLMLGLAVLLALAWWISRSLEATQVRLEAEQRYVLAVHQAQEALLASEKRYRNWVANVPIGICRLAHQPRGLLLSANPAFVRMLGCNDACEVVGKNLVDFMFNPIGLEYLYERHLEPHGMAISFDTSFNHPQRQRVYARLTSIASRDDQGNVEYYETLLEDSTQDKLFRQRMKSSRDHLQMLVGRAPVLLWTTNSEGVIDFVEGAALGGLGGREEIIRKRIHDFSPHPQMADEILRRGIGGETLSFTMPIKERLFEVSTGPWHNERGHVVGIIGVCIDVTRRQVAEQQLRAVVDNAPLLLWTTDRRGVLTFMQGAAMMSIGYTAENILGQSIDSMGDNEELGREIIRRCLAGETFAFESMLRGRFFESSAAPLRGAGGEIAGIIGVSIDITDQRQAKRDLEAQREQMELVFRHSSDGLCIREMDLGSYKRRLVMFNDMFAQMSGYGREELMARYGNDKLLKHYNSDLERRRQREMILGDKAIQGVDSWIRPDGKENCHEFTSVPIRKDEGRLLIVDIRRDITDRLKTEEALKQAHRQLVAAREQERRRLARELHDSIGQALVALQLSMRTALSESGIPPGQALAQRLTEATQQCSRLVGEIRQLCHGLYPPTLESLGLVAALQQLVRSCGKSGPLLELQHDEQLSSRRFSPDVEITLFRIAQEAVSNAIRHSQATRIDISLSLTPDGLLWLRICDDGKGFDVESGQRGLGMISMKERALSVGGVLVICSEPGQSVVKAGVPAQAPTPAS